MSALLPKADMFPAQMHATTRLMVAAEPHIRLDFFREESVCGGDGQTD
jgi:hypothetical protein